MLIHLIIFGWNQNNIDHPIPPIMIRFSHKISFLFLFLISAFTIQSQIYVDGSASGTNDGSSWTNAFINLQDGLNATSSGSEVWVAQGTYTVY